MVRLDGRPVDADEVRELGTHLPAGAGHACTASVDAQAGFAADTAGRCLASLDDRLLAIVDARLDARGDLVDALRARGRRVSTATDDATLILHAYEAFGAACPSWLLGDFVFAIWDRSRRALLCARDHFGIRTLYYARVGGTLVFGNALHCVRRHPAVPASLDESAVADFLLFGSCTATDKAASVFSAVRRLPAGHALRLSTRGLAVERYWTPSLEAAPPGCARGAACADRFRDVLRTAVADRMGDRRVVVSMSGGMDSTTVAALASAIARDRGGAAAVTAITGVYDRQMPDGERRYASLVATHLGIPIHFFPYDDYPLLRPMPAGPEPIEDYLPARTRDMRRTVAAHGVVALLGRSADLLFSLSPTRVGALVRDGALVSTLGAVLRHYIRHRRLLPVGTGLVARLRGRGRAIHTRTPAPFPVWLDPGFSARLGLVDRWRAWWSWAPTPPHARHPIPHTQLLQRDWSVSTEHLGTLEFTPAEYCDPFLDLRVVRFVLSLPQLPWFADKYLLRRAMRGHLPTEVLQRPKTNLRAELLTHARRQDAGWIDRWAPTPALSAYVRRDVIPAVHDRTGGPVDAHVHLRPLLLDRWLRTCERPSASGRAP